MLLDILLPMVIFIPISKSCFSLQTPLLWSNQCIREYSNFFGLLPEENLCPGYCYSFGRHWCNSERITTSMTASRTCLGLKWCHWRVYEWYLEEDTQDVCPSPQRICQEWGGSKNWQGCWLIWQTTLTWLWMRMTLRSSWGIDYRGLFRSGIETHSSTRGKRIQNCRKSGRKGTSKNIHSERFRRSFWKPQQSPSKVWKHRPPTTKCFH